MAKVGLRAWLRFHRLLVRPVTAAHWLSNQKRRICLKFWKKILVSNQFLPNFSSRRQSWRHKKTLGSALWKLVWRQVSKFGPKISEAKGVELNFEDIPPKSKISKRKKWFKNEELNRASKTVSRKPIFWQDLLKIERGRNSVWLLPPIMRPQPSLIPPKAAGTSARKSWPAPRPSKPDYPSPRSFPTDSKLPISYRTWGSIWECKISFR